VTSDAFAEEPAGETRCALSYVVPAHNSSGVIRATVDALDRRLGSSDAEIVVVENGSTDDTWPVLQQLEASRTPSAAPRLVPLRSSKGMGEALRQGILVSRGDRVVLTADDLPFGFDDLDEAEQLPDADIVIGSKAHPRSEAERGRLRAVLSWGFRTLRRLLLQSTVRDPQGTFVVRGDLARDLVHFTTEKGFLFTTELVALAEHRGVRPVEVPVRLVAGHGEHPSRVRMSDIVDMGSGMLRIRRSIRSQARS
jgi:dolichyl-phosphate beta-glucosyltransferase